MSRIAGVAFITLAGRARALSGEAAYQVSGVVREAVVGQSGFQGYKEKIVPGNITGKFRDGQDVSLTELNGVTDETVILELANGKTVIGRNMFWSGEQPKADAEEAEIEFKFEGPDVTDQPTA